MNMEKPLSVIELPSTTSTNDYVARNRQALQAPTLVMAGAQSAGRGQQGNRWQSLPGDLTASFLVAPPELPANHFFVLSMVTSLAVVNALSALGLAPRIKWPNDVMLGDKKVAGLLIETHATAGAIVQAIIGIGINLSPRPPELCHYTPLATSLAQEGTRTPIEVKALALSIYTQAQTLWQLASEQGLQAITTRYHQCLYRNQGFHPFATPTERFNARIDHVDIQGVLHLRLEDNTTRTFRFKEVRHLF